jgi:hypothetical protein
MLGTTTRTADSLGLGIDMNLGMGWPYGGPHITPEHTASKLVVQRYTLGAGQRPAVTKNRAARILSSWAARRWWR